MIEDSESNYIQSSDGLKLYYIIRKPENPKAVVCLLHGHGEHIGRYEHVVDYLSEKGIASVGFDFRGHGKSEGSRGHMPSMDTVLDDVEESLKFTRVNFLDIPMFLFGHSFGGCVTLTYVLKKPVTELTGFIASSPWLALAFEPPKWKVKMGEYMASVFPRLTLASELDTTHLSKDEELVKEYVSDPLVHNKVSAKFFSETVKAGSYVQQKAEDTKLPGLVYHGDSDQIISFSATKRTAEKSEKIEFHAFDGVFHEPHNDLEKQKVLSLLESWISTKSKQIVAEQS
ncbi:MAG: lysophospholipase [Cyclobacteriaceae bacterium]